MSDKDDAAADAQDMGPEQGFILHAFTADPGQDPMRVDKFLTNRIEGVSRNRVQAAIGDGQVRVNDKVVKANFKIKPGDRIELRVQELRDPLEIHPEDIPLDIRYEDDELMVIHKPAGMVVHPGHGNYDGTLLNALAHYFDVEVSFAGKRPWLVHRIDKDTSGLMVIAKTDSAMNGLSTQFKAHSIERTYVALCWGRFEEPSGTVDTFIARDPADRKRFRATEDQGKQAITHYEVMEDFLFTSLVRCTLETGRTHQIRVHMRHLGHPLFNDTRYGGDKILKGVVFSKYRQFIDNCFTLLPRQALHAQTLGFTHPSSGERLTFTSELPPDFQAVVDKWRAVDHSGQFS